MKSIIIYLIILFIGITTFAQTTYTWNGSVSTDWNTAANWTPAGIPSATDHIIINTAPNNLVLLSNQTVTNFTINSGLIDLNGFQLSTSGNVALNNGTINGGASGRLFCINGNVIAGTATTGITLNTRFNAQVPSITIRNSIFNDSTIIYKTTLSTINDNWRGGNSFNAYFYLENQSNNHIQLGSNATDPADVFNALAEFRISGNCRIRVRAYGNVTFNGKAKFYCDQNYFTTNTDDRIQISRFSPSSAVFNDSTFFYLTGNNFNDIQIAFASGTSVTFNAPTLIYRLNNSNNQSLLTFGESGGTVNFNNNVYFYNNGSIINSLIVIRNATLSNGYSFNADPINFSSGYLQIENCLQIGTTTQNLILSSNSRLYLNNNTWNGTVNFSSGRITTQNSNYNNTTILEKTGANWDASIGGNIFNGITTLVKSASSTGQFSMGQTNPDTFNGLLYLKNYASAERIILANNSSGNLFNDNIEFESSATSTGIWIGNTASSSSTLAFGKAMTIGPAGFTSGDLRFYNFTQLGTASQNLTITGTGFILSDNSTWNGPTQFIAPRVYISNTTHNNTAYWEKTGANNDASPGGNIFNGTTTTLSNAGNGFFRMSNNFGTPDTYNGNVIWKRTGTGFLDISYNNAENYFGNISFDGTQTITAAQGPNGRVVLTGTNNQFINKIGTNPQCRINRLTINKSSNEATLNTPLQISNNLTFTSGIINSDASNLLIFENATTATGASNASFVNGPVRKIGNQAFTFPVGKKGDYYGMHFYNAYRPIAISAPANSTHHFTAEYFMQDPHPTYNHGSLAPTLTHISNCEYWILDRTNGTSNVNVTLSYSDYGPAVACSGVTNQADLRVARWNGTQWVDHGNGGTTGTPSNGTVVTSAVVTAFSPFTLASANASNNPLPIELLSFNAIENKNKVDLFWSTASEINNDYFEVEKSVDGINFIVIDRIKGAGNSNTTLHYKTIDNNPYIGINYYRIKQVDFDGTSSYSEIIALNFKSKEHIISIYPNPAKEFLTITNLMENNHYIIQIFDISGKLVVSENINNSISHTLNIKYLTSGFYTLQVYSENDILYTNKLLIK